MPRTRAFNLCRSVVKAVQVRSWLESLKDLLVHDVATSLLLGGKRCGAHAGRITYEGRIVTALHGRSTCDLPGAYQDVSHAHMRQQDVSSSHTL